MQNKLSSLGLFLSINLLCTISMVGMEKRLTIKEPEQGSEQLDIEVVSEQDYSDQQIPSASFYKTSPDRKYAIAGYGGGCDEYYLMFTNVDAKTTKDLKGHKSQVKATEFSSDSKYLVTGSYDETIRIWETETGKCLKVIEGFGASTVFLKFINVSDLKIITRYTIPIRTLSRLELEFEGWIMHDEPLCKTVLTEFIMQLKEHDNFIKKDNDQFADINIRYLTDVKTTFIELGKFIKNLILLSTLGNKKSGLKKLL